MKNPNYNLLKICMALEYQQWNFIKKEIPANRLKKPPPPSLLSSTLNTKEWRVEGSRGKEGERERKRQRDKKITEQVEWIYKIEKEGEKSEHSTIGKRFCNKWKLCGMPMRSIHFPIPKKKMRKKKFPPSRQLLSFFFFPHPPSHSEFWQFNYILLYE